MRKKNAVISILLVLVVITILAFIVVSDYFQNKSLQPPKLSLSEEEWGFGMVKPNDKPTHIFMVKNEGNEDLIIERVRVSCGCVKTSISTKLIKPGKSAELKATFDTTGYDGKIEKDIYIKSNDPLELGLEKKVSLNIEIEHYSKPVISIFQNEWNLGLISQGDKSNFNFIIENKGDEDLIIEKIDTYEHITHNFILPLTISPEEKHEATLSYNSIEHELGEVREAITILSNDPKRAVSPLRVKGYIKEKVKPAISIWPVEINFNLKADSEEDFIGKFTLENLGDKAVKIVSVKTSADFLASLDSEFDLRLEEKEDLQIILLKDKAIKEIHEEEADEYIYLTIALPVKISK